MDLFFVTFKGHHIYMDASKQKLNATARLASPSFIGDKYVCLSFYYAMYGRDVNQLNVYVSQGQTTKLYWTESDNQGDDWHHQMVDIGESPQPMQVIFEGVVGDSDESDIDLDDIWIFDGSCPPPGIAFFLLACFFFFFNSFSKLKYFLCLIANCCNTVVFKVSYLIKITWL